MLLSSAANDAFKSGLELGATGKKVSSAVFSGVCAKTCAVGSVISVTANISREEIDFFNIFLEVSKVHYRPAHAISRSH
jgi:hypothetical protein